MDGGAEADASGGAFSDRHLGVTELVHGRLVDPSQVCLRQQVVVDDCYFADAQPHDLLENRRACAARTDDADVERLQQALTFAAECADLAVEEVAAHIHPFVRQKLQATAGDSHPLEGPLLLARPDTAREPRVVGRAAEDE